MVVRRVWALVAVGVLIAVGLGVRASGAGGAFQQCAGTALYASMIYAGVFVLRPRTTPVVAGAVAVGFCWLVEFSQLTGIPAALSAHSVLARLALGVEFDPTDLLWYPVGVVPLVVVHWWLARRGYVPRTPIS